MLNIATLGRLVTSAGTCAYCTILNYQDIILSFEDGTYSFSQTPFVGKEKDDYL